MLSREFFVVFNLHICMLIIKTFNCIKTCDISRSPYCIVSALYNAFKGNFENGYAFAGSNAWRATRIMSVHETITELLEGWKRASAPAVAPV